MSDLDTRPQEQRVGPRESATDGALVITARRVPTATQLVHLGPGGEPYAEETVMGWNSVGRRPDEVVGYREAWTARDPRHPPVVDRTERVLEAPPRPMVALKPRPHRGQPR